MYITLGQKQSIDVLCIKEVIGIQVDGRESMCDWCIWLSGFMAHQTLTLVWLSCHWDCKRSRLYIPFHYIHSNRYSDTMLSYQFS